MCPSSTLELAIRNGIFFITICTRKREYVFAEDPMNPFQLSDAGEIAKQCWLEIADHFPHIMLGEFIVMPNHIHGILVFKKPAVFVQRFATAIPGSLITVIKSYKSAVTKAVNRLPNYQEYKVWQRGYYDHRVRNMQELRAIQKYISENPQRWVEKYKDI